MIHRILIAIALLVVAAYCVFGFLATFEPNDPMRQLAWRVVYALIGATCAVYAGWLLISRPAR